MENESREESYTLGLEKNEFDSGASFGSNIKGEVVLYSIGEWQTLDGGSPLAYLEIIANGIKAECMPDNVVFTSPTLALPTYYDLKRISRFVVIDFRDEDDPLLSLSIGRFD